MRSWPGRCALTQFESRGLAVGGGVIIAIAAFAVVGIGGSRASSGGHLSVPARLAPARNLARGTATSRLTADGLRALAIDVAKRNGNASPSTIEAVRITHREAWCLMFPGMPSGLLPADRRPVYLIVMTGRFIDRGVGPANVTVTGTQLHLVVDMNGRVLDGGRAWTTFRRPTLEGSRRSCASTSEATTLARVRMGQ